MIKTRLTVLSAGRILENNSKIPLCVFLFSFLRIIGIEFACIMMHKNILLDSMCVTSLHSIGDSEKSKTLLCSSQPPI